MIYDLYKMAGPVESAAGREGSAEYIEALSGKAGHPGRYADPKTTFRFLEQRPGSPDPFVRYLRSGHLSLFIVPLDDVNGSVHGWLVRSVDKRRFYSVMGTWAYVAGLWSFSNFTYGKTIVVVEGVKDALAVQRFYPYCLAMLTGAVSLNAIELVKRLTDRVLVIGDKDKGGDALRRRWKESGLNVMSLPVPLKDPGDYFSRPGVVEPFLKLVPSFCR